MIFFLLLLWRFKTKNQQKEDNSERSRSHVRSIDEREREKRRPPPAAPCSHPKCRFHVDSITHTCYTITKKRKEKRRRLDGIFSFYCSTRPEQLREERRRTEEVSKRRGARVSTNTHTAVPTVTTHSHTH